MPAPTAGNFSGLNQGDKTMRKRIISQVQQETTPPDLDWLNLDELAEVELTSEDVAHPIESALLQGMTSGWRAVAPGEQKVRILFTNPQHIRRIWLNFAETHTERTQECVLRWAPDGDQSYRDIFRRQWKFSPLGATSEIEDLHVDLPSVTVLELSVTPDISGGNALASLEQLRLA